MAMELADNRPRRLMAPVTRNISSTQESHMAQPVDTAPPGMAEYRILQALAGTRRRLRARLPLRWRRRLAVFVGGMLGGGLRLGMSELLNDTSGVPWGTLAANLAGSLLLGYLLTRFLRAAPDTTLAIPLLCTGLLGSWTTFSTFSVEAWILVQQGRVELAATYAIGSVVLGLGLAATGIRLAERRP